MEVDTNQPGLDIEKLKETVSGINSTPFEWNCNGKQYNMKFISGFAGAQIEGEYIRTQMGWGVAESKDSSNPKN
jgi:hypothetical protein